jgi:phage repressor protein C with HTH and peptisase S24 domain
MARGSYKPNVKNYYKIGSVEIEKYVSSFYGGNGFDVNDGKEIISFPAIDGINVPIHQILTVKGDSMSPKIEEGDQVIIDTGKIKPKKGDIIAVVLNGELMIKLFEPGALCLYLSSINQDYEPIRVYEEDECFVVGKAWKIVKDAVI